MAEKYLANPKTFEFNGKTVTLTTDEMYKVMWYYERYCTAEYLLDTYDKMSEKKAWNIACQVREMMADYSGMTESEAIDEVIDNEGIKDDEESEEE